MGSLVRVTVIALCVALGSVAPLSQAAVAGTKPAFDWTQFMKGVKRAVAADVSQPDTQEVDIDYQDSQFQIKPSAGNPMSPFLSLKPSLPVKPSFLPPVVDPQYFIDKKTALLDGLFSPASYFAGKKTAFLTTLFQQLATPPPNTTGTLQRRQVAPPPLFDPQVMADKKTAFLDKLFASFNTPAPGDDITDITDTPDAATVKPTIVPPGFWMPLPPKPAVKPTIVPPDFWLPFPPSQAAAPLKPIVDPSVLIDKKAQFLNDLMNSLAPTTEPTPTYDDKITEFLDKLLEALTSPSLDFKRSVMDVVRSARSVVATPEVALDAKDRLTDTFIAELTGIKNDMVETVTQMMKIQKVAVPPVGTKPGKKGATPFAGLWGPMAGMKPTPDPTIPLQEKMAALNQMFDMLTNLQKDVVTAVNQAGLTTTQTPPTKNATNTTILGLLRKKLMEMDDGTKKRDVKEAETEARSIKMAVHQGYQSLPPGAAEYLQAGGGSSPEGKEGGGISLQKATANHYDEWESRRHHHHD